METFSSKEEFDIIAKRGSGPYFDDDMNSSYSAYLGKTVQLSCVVHAVINPKSVSNSNHILQGICQN